MNNNNKINFIYAALFKTKCWTKVYLNANIYCNFSHVSLVLSSLVFSLLIIGSFFVLLYSSTLLCILVLSVYSSTLVCILVLYFVSFTQGVCIVLLHFMYYFILFWDILILRNCFIAASHDDVTIIYKFEMNKVHPSISRFKIQDSICLLSIVQQ